MTKFKFIGDPRYGGDGPDVLEAFGLAFPKGKAVEVEDKDIADRLAANNHFEAVNGAAKADADDGDEMTLAEVLAGAESMHHKTLGAHARRLLGDDAPTAKADIIEALESASR